MKKLPLTSAQLEKNRRYLQKVGIIFVVILVVNFAYQIWHKYHHSPIKTRPPCLLTKKACSVYLPSDQIVTFEIKPKKISPTEKTTFLVTLEKMYADKIVIWLTKPHDSFVKPRELTLETLDKQHYQGHTRLTEAENSSEPWLAIVQIVFAEQTISIPFKF